MKHSFINFEVMISFVIIFIIFIGGFYAIIKQNADQINSIDPLAGSLAEFIPYAIVLMIIVAVLLYAVGRKPPGAWGGEYAVGG